MSEKERAMSDYTPPPEAVEAAARALWSSWNPNGPAWRATSEEHREQARSEARAVLTAVGPIVAAEVRGQREAFLPSDTLDPAWIAGWHAAVDHVAAHIESGGEPTAPVTVYDKEGA